MHTTIEINNALEVISAQINEKTMALGPLREAHQIAKATYENNFSRYLLETKAKYPEYTVQEIKAKAINFSHSYRLEAIKAESAYRKVCNELRALNTEYEGLREQSFNIRAELHRLR
jgi:hypothetical protein